MGRKQEIRRLKLPRWDLGSSVNAAEILAVLFLATASAR